MMLVVVVMAAVKKSTRVSLLFQEDGMLLKCVNDSSRSVYAFEMMPPPAVDAAQNDVTQQEVGSENCVANNTVTVLPKPTAQLTNVLQACDIVNDLLLCASESNRNNSPVSDGFGADEGSDRLNNRMTESSLTASLGGDVALLETNPDVDWQYNQLTDMATDDNLQVLDGAGTDGFCGTGLWSSSLLSPLDVGCCGDEGDQCTAAAAVGNGDVAGQVDTPRASSSPPARSDGKPCAGEEKQTEDGGGDAVETTRVADEWKSCAICLEEMEDDQLLVHAQCGSTLCPNCHWVGTL